MDEKELLDKIRHSASDVRVPENLSPEKIEEKLKKSKKNHLQRRKTMIRWIEAAAVLMLVAAGGSQAGWYKQPEQVRETEAEVRTFDETEAEFIQVASEEELYQKLKENMVQARVYTDDEFGNELMLLEESYVTDSAMPGGAAKSAENETAEAYSGTNVREAGIDEGDVVKTDGKYLYVLHSGNSVKIVDIQNDTMEEILTLKPEDLGENIEDMFIDGERLILVTSGQLSSMEESDPDVYEVKSRVYTSVYVYDISDRSNPEISGKMTQEGYYRQSRKNGEYVYLLTEYSPYLDEKFEDSQVMPLINEQKVEISDVYMNEAADQKDYLVVSGFSIKNPEEMISSKAIVSGAEDFYMSRENLYIYCSSWRSGDASTQILKFACDKGMIEAKGIGEMPGYLNDTFSIDEYQGYLRVLTTENGSDRKNNLFLLDEEMNQVGSIRDLAQGETIKSARFMGDMAYFVTFRQTDPLFCADLSDPENPQILSELKVSGFSSYLHGYGENLLLGIGYEADETTGGQTGIKLSMFDTSDPSGITEKHRYVIDGASYLPADYNYKAILADPEKNIIGFVCDENYLVFRYDEEKGFENLLTRPLGDGKYWNGQENCRGVYVGDDFYIVVQEEILRFDMEQDFALTDRLNWN